MTRMRASAATNRRHGQIQGTELMNKNQGVRDTSVSAVAGMRLPGIARQLAALALLAIVSGADGQQLPNADQLVVTSADQYGNLVYYLGITPSSTTPTTPVIASSAMPINTDASSHGSFDALAWVPNSVCNSQDLIVTDASAGKIVRYAGASTVINSTAGCYNPASGAPAVKPNAQVLYTWSKGGSGPAQPNGVSADASGNVFVVSSSGGRDSKPSVWVLPFNTSATPYCKAAVGAYCAPVLVDNKFCGTLTLFLAETLVASTGAKTSGGATLWNAGDLLVLVGDSFDARLIAYPQSQLYKGGQLNLKGLPLNSPSTPIPWLKFLGELAAPFGMDLCPGNTALCADPSILFTTIDGRILSFDTVKNKFVTDIADRQGPGLQKIKVGSYANIPYAFVAQLEANNTGRILAFGPPPPKGPAYNTPLATVSKIAVSPTSTTPVRNPMGLAVAYGGSGSLPAVAQDSATPCTPAPCVIAPLGPELVSSILAYPGDMLSGTVTEQNCIVQVDPRVVINNGAWSCPNAPSLQIGNGSTICPSFPTAFIPGSVCGHSGPTGSGFVAIEGTATGIDPNDNNAFITTAGNVDAVLPGANNLKCTPFTGPFTGQIPMIAWGTRSDFTEYEGTIAEDSYNPGGTNTLGGTAGFLTELTGGCDTSTTGSRGISIFAIGLGISNPMPSYVYTLEDQKYNALTQTLNGANISDMNVYNQLYTYIQNAAGYVYAASQSAASFTSNINCALNQIATADSYMRGYLPDFSSNLAYNTELLEWVGNPNPAGEIDGRLANWYMLINTALAGNPPYLVWPLPPASVPACTLSKQPQITSFSSQPSGDSLNLMWNTINANSCTLTTLYAQNNEPSGYNFLSTPTSIGGPNFLFNTDYPIGGVDSGYSKATPPYVFYGWGSDTYTLTCYGAANQYGVVQAATESILNTSGFTASTPTPLAIATFVTDGYGDLGWTTANSSPNTTTCTITDAYGGPPYYQSPIGNLPPNNPLQSDGEGQFPTGGPYPYYYNSALNPGESEYPAVGSDTITLTCSDKYNGTAFSTLTLYPNSD
jgi:hypothetical protein